MKTENLMNEFKEKYFVLPHSKEENLYSIRTNDGNKSFVGMVENRSDGLYFVLNDVIGKQLHYSKINTIEEFENLIEGAKVFYEGFGLKPDVGDMTYTETALMEMALDEHLEYIAGRKLNYEYEFGCCEYKEQFGNVRISFNTSEENGKAEIGITFLLPDQHVISETFDNIKDMLSYIDSALGALILEPAYYTFSILDRISASKLKNLDLTDVLVKAVDFNTLDTKQQTLKEYLIDKLKTAVGELERKEE